MTRPLNAVRLVTPSAQLVTKTVGRARAGTAMAAPFSAPRTSFNGTITGTRAIALADMDIEDIRADQERHRDHRQRRRPGHRRRSAPLLPAGPRRAAVELAAGDRAGVGARGQSKRSQGANKVSALFAKLGTDTEDPLERLRDLAERNKNAKEHHAAISADSLQDWAEFAAPRTFGLAVRTYAGLRLAERHPVVHNLVISNVPGPPVPLYFMGAEILALYPLGPVFHGAGVNVTVMSNNGQVHVGIIACRDSMPDVDDLVQRFPVELAALKKAVEVQSKPTPIRRARKKASAGTGG